jgi:hypothetical protein
MRHGQKKYQIITMMSHTEVTWFLESGPNFLTTAIKNVTVHCLTTQFTSLWGSPKFPYEGFILASVFRCIRSDSVSSAWYLITQAEANSFGLLTVVVNDITTVSRRVPAAPPSTSKISVRASQVRHLQTNPLKLLREITAVYLQKYKKLSLSHTHTHCLPVGRIHKR